MTQDELSAVLEKHRLWLEDKEGGKRADLSGATGNMGELKSLFLETWPITYTAEVMQIGCERHPIEEWWAFDDERIARMDSEALDWWKKWKPVLQQIIEMSPATPTQREEEEAAA